MDTSQGAAAPGEYTQPPSHVAVAITLNALAKASSLKTEKCPDGYAATIHNVGLPITSKPLVSLILTLMALTYSLTFCLN